MEVQEKSKKRELIKTIAIIFLVILLILTFFSNTIMNYSLPEVATQIVTSGTINAKIRGSGTVEPNESYEVVIDQTREVRSICVKVGDSVQPGDLLFVLGDTESSELTQAQDALREAELNYQKQILNLSKGYATDDMAVRTIQRALERAMQAQEENLVTDLELTYAKGDLAAAEAQLSQVQLLLEELKARQSSSQGEDSAYQAAKAKVTELEAQVKALKDSIKGYEEELAKLDTGESVSAERAVQDAKNALDKAQTKWAADWAANLADMKMLTGFSRLSGSPQSFSSSDQVEIERKLSDLKRSEESAKEQYQQELELWNKWDAIPSDDIDSQQKFLNQYGYPPSRKPTEPDEYHAQVRAAFDAVLASQAAAESAQEAYTRALEDRSSGVNTAAQQRQALQQQLNTAKGDLSTAQGNLRSAQAELESASSSNSQLGDQVKLYESSERELTAQRDKRKTELEALEQKQVDYEAAVKEVEAQQKALEEALSGKDIDKQLDNLELQAARLDIEQKREQVEKYREASVDTEVKAKVAGVIKSISVTAGKDNVAGQAMAVIDVVERGYTIQVSVTNDQAKQVKVGDSADVTSYRWGGGDIEAVLEAIVTDPSAPGQKKLLIFRLSGDVEAGSTINLSIGQRSVSAETIVPKSALREDTNGKFVLIVTSKSTPLGNRYTATRADVQVLGEDDNNAAVSGVSPNDYVITTSSKPINPGSQVRMVEDA